MNPENTTPYTTPSMSLALEDTLPSGSFAVDKVDFYQPRVYMPNTLDLSNSDTPSVKTEENLAKSLFNKMSKTVKAQPYNRFSDMNNPIRTPLSETLRYQDANLGGYNVDDPNQEYKYGEAQSTWDSIVSRGAQTFGNFASAYLGSFTDLPALITAGSNYMDSNKQGLDRAMDAYRGLYDNLPANALEEFNKSILDKNLTYDTRFSEEHPILSRKILGDIFASSGYGLGSMAGMLTEDALIGIATGGTALAPVLGIQLARGASKLLKVLNSTSEATDALRGSLKAGQSAATALDQAYKTSKLQKGLWGINMYTNNLFESSIEAKQTQESTEAKLAQQFQTENGYVPSGDQLVAIKKAANDSANATFLGNMALLAITNKIEFGDIIKRMQIGKEAFDYTEKGLARIVLDDGIDNLKIANAAASQVVEPTTFYGKLVNSIKNGASKATGFTRSSIGEGIEEGGQFSISTATEDYYTQKYNAKGLESGYSWYSSISKALGETVSTEEGWMNILAGIGGGVLLGAGRKALGLDPKNKEINREALLAQLNSTKLTDIITGSGTKLAEHVAGVGISTKAINDWYSLQANQHAQVFNWALSAIKGRNNYIDLRRQQLSSAKDLEGEDFKTMFGVEDTPANKESIHSYLDKINDDINTIEAAHKRVSSVYRNPYGYIKDPSKENLQKYYAYERYKDELVYHISKQKKNEELIEYLNREGDQINSGIDHNFVMDLATKSGFSLKGDADKLVYDDKEGKTEGILKVREELLKNQKELEDLVSTGVASDVDKKRKVNADKFLDKLEDVIKDWDTDLQKRVEFVRDLYNEKSKDIIGAKPMTNTDVIQLLGLGMERAKVKASQERSLGLFNSLGTKTGFEKFLSLEKGTGESFAEQEAKKAETFSDPTPEESELVNEKVVRDFSRLPDDKKAEIFAHVASKIKNKVRLTESESKLYGRYKADIDALNKVTDEPINVKDEIKDPQTDSITGLKEGDVLLSRRSKEKLTILKFEKNRVLLQKEDGSKLYWNNEKFHHLVGIEEYTPTGEIITQYTADDLKALQNKYEYQFLLDFGLSHGGARPYRQSDEEYSSSLEVLVYPSDFDGTGARGDIKLPIIMTRRGIKALILEDKKQKDPEPSTVPWIYAGRPKDSSDKRTAADTLSQYGFGEEANTDLTVALKEVINSPYASVTEIELARYLINYVPVGTKVTVTKNETLLSSTRGILIGLDAIEDSPIEVILVHEALHLLTYKGLRDNKEFKDKIQQLYLRARGIAKIEKMHGKFRGLEESTNHLDEFITEALTNQEFMKFLGEAKSTPSTTAIPSNLWKSFVNAIQKLFGIRTEGTLLEYLSDLVFSEIENINVRKNDTGSVQGMSFDPNLIFSKIATRGSAIPNANIIALRNNGSLTEETIIKNGVFKLAAPKGNFTPQGYTPYSYTNSNGQKIIFDNLFKSTPTQIIEVYVGNGQIGILQPISTWAFKRGDNFLPLTELTEGEYTKVTGNLLQSYDQFMSIIKGHQQIEELISNKPIGTEINISTIQNNLNFNINLGPLATIKKESERPLLVELEANFPDFKDQKTPFIISLSKAFDPNTNGWIDRPIGYLTTIPTTAIVHQLVRSVVEKNYEKLKGLNSRYIAVVSVTGKWESEEDLDFIVTHPTALTSKQKADLVKNLQEAIIKNEPIYDYYIADTTTGKRELSFYVKDGLMHLTAKGAFDDKSTFSHPIAAQELEELSFTEFVNLINSRLGDKLPAVTERDFKVFIEDDAVVNPIQLATQLSSVVAPHIRNTLVSVRGKVNILNPRASAANEVIPQEQTPTTGLKADGTLDFAQLNQLSDDEGEYGDEDPIEVITPAKQAPVQSNTPSLKAQAKKKGSGLRYELATPTVSQETINEYKRICGS